MCLGADIILEVRLDSIQEDVYQAPQHFYGHVADVDLKRVAQYTFAQKY